MALFETRRADAYPFYIESQTGAAHFRSTDKIFNSGNASASDLGIGFNLGFFYSPFESFKGLDLQFGLQAHYLSATLGEVNYAVAAPAAVFRLQFLGASLSAGAAPYMWYQALPATPFSRLTSTYMFSTEGGLQYALTPKFSLGASLTLFWFYANSAIVAPPSSHAAFVMRFYFGKSSGGASSSKELDWNGWRYIGK